MVEARTVFGMTPPTTTVTLCAPCFLSSAISCGTSVRWPAAWDEMPTTCTSESIAWRATSAGVYKEQET